MSAKKYILALDAGTTSERAVLFDKAGRLIGQASKEIKQMYPHPAWVEHDPMDLLSTLVGVMSEVMVKCGVQPEEISAVGLTNQRETTIVWDKYTGKPVYNAIVWQCRRTSETLAEMKVSDTYDVIRKKTGLMCDPYFSASKVAWILDNVAGARERAEAGDLLFGTVDSWLIYKLSEGNVHVTDHTNASRTMLYNIHELCWDQELLDLFNIPLSMMPQVKPSISHFANISSEFVRSPLPIMGVAGDQQASLFGHCCFAPGQVKNTYGTGCFLLMNTGEHAVLSQNGLLTTIGISDGKSIQYALEGSVFVAGAVVQWLRDELKIIENAQETETLAQSVDSSDGVYVVPAFTGLGAPYWNPDARGVICGISRGTNKEQIVRAALESMAYQSYDIIEAMQADATTKLRSLSVDGGASDNNFLMQFQADILQAHLERPTIREITALGAAYLAGLGSGFFESTEELMQLHESQRIVPEINSEKLERRLKGWHDAVRRALR